MSEKIKQFQESHGHLMTTQLLKFKEQLRLVFMILEEVDQEKDYLILMI